jgi:hypothetical protein
MEQPQEPVRLYRAGTPAPPAVDPPVDADVLPLKFETDGKGHVEDPEELAASTLSVLWSRPSCPPSDWSPDQYDRFYAAQEIAGAWLARQAGVKPLESTQAELFPSGWQAFTALPERTQRERIIDYRDGVLECRTDLYAELTKAAS